MSDSQDVLHAAILDMEEEDKEASKPKKKIIKPTAQLWETLL